MGLEGSWVNELGSSMQIDSVLDGLVTGTYQTAVSTGCASGSFALAGRTDVESGGQSVGPRRPARGPQRPGATRIPDPNLRDGAEPQPCGSATLGPRWANDGFRSGALRAAMGALRPRWARLSVH
jgi:avidin family protein